MRDTAFLLYAGWPRAVSTSSGNGSAGGGTVSLLCESAGNYCEGATACQDVGGQLLNQFNCPSYGEYCCSVRVAVQTCGDSNGVICTNAQECSGREINSADGSCCLDSCIEKRTGTDSCGAAGNTCRTSCFSDEEQTSDSCVNSAEICCRAGQITPTPKSGSSLWTWIIILGILILIVILGILFRNKLRVSWFKFSGKAKTSPIERPFGPSPAEMARTRMMSAPRFGPPMTRTPAPIRRTPATQQMPRGGSGDKELDDTLKKLKEMSE